MPLMVAGHYVIKGTILRHDMHSVSFKLEENAQNLQACLAPLSVSRFGKYNVPSRRGAGLSENPQKLVIK